MLSPLALGLEIGLCLPPADRAASPLLRPRGARLHRPWLRTGSSSHEAPLAPPRLDGIGSQASRSPLPAPCGSLGSAGSLPPAPCRLPAAASLMPPVRRGFPFPARCRQLAVSRSFCKLTAVSLEPTFRCGRLVATHFVHGPTAASPVQPARCLQCAAARSVPLALCCQAGACPYLLSAALGATLCPRVACCLGWRTDPGPRPNGSAAAAVGLAMGCLNPFLASVPLSRTLHQALLI